MLLAEDLLLLLTDDDTGRLVVSGYEMDIALAGAHLTELSLAGRVGTDDKKRIVVLDASPTGDEILDRALAVLQEREGKKPSSVLSELGKGVREALYERLTSIGILRAEHGRVLGIFPSTSWPTSSADHEAALRRALTAVLVQGVTPQPREGVLIALLSALRSTHRVVDPQQHDLKRRDLDRRAKEVAEASWASDAVRETIDAMTAAMVVTIAAAAATSSAAG